MAKLKFCKDAFVSFCKKISKMICMFCKKEVAKHIPPSQCTAVV